MIYKLWQGDLKCWWRFINVGVGLKRDMHVQHEATSLGEEYMPDT